MSAIQINKIAADTITIYKGYVAGAFPILVMALGMTVVTVPIDLGFGWIDADGGVAHTVALGIVGGVFFTAVMRMVIFNLSPRHAVKVGHDEFRFIGMMLFIGLAFALSVTLYTSITTPLVSSLPADIGRVVLSGLLALPIIVMVILLVRLLPSGALIVGEKMGPIDALVESWRWTQGRTIWVFFLMLLANAPFLFVVDLADYVFKALSDILPVILTSPGLSMIENIVSVLSAVFCAHVYLLISSDHEAVE